MSNTNPVNHEGLAKRFKHHPPTGDKIEKHETIREVMGDMAQYLNKVLPGGREAALALTNLEQVMFWSNAAIARDVPRAD